MRAVSQTAATFAKIRGFEQTNGLRKMTRAGARQKFGASSQTT
jgi:hypothetical protein